MGCKKARKRATAERFGIFIFKFNDTRYGFWGPPCFAITRYGFLGSTPFLLACSICHAVSLQVVVLAFFVIVDAILDHYDLQYDKVLCVLRHVDTCL